MHTVLIAHSSEEIATILDCVISCKYSTTICSDSENTVNQILLNPPDALILDMSLPVTGGIGVLERIKGCLPDVILATVWFPDQQIINTLSAYGVDHVTVLPGKIGDIIYKLEDMLQQKSAENPTLLKTILRQLHIPGHVDGYQQLLMAIPLFAEDPSSILSKEIYPVIARALHLTSGKCVERSIRAALDSGWNNGDKELWRKYFPDAQRRPAVKTFIAEISHHLSSSRP